MPLQTLDPRKVLKQYWGYDAFRPLQEDIVVSVLQGRDTLALLPTGGGKSICFQVPALCKEGLCLVVSPLIALMQDQVENLKSRNIPAACLVQGMTFKEIDEILEACMNDGYRFLYVSPERLQSELFLERFKQMPINLIAIDEAHCISQWGYDFRPPYLQIAQVRVHHPKVPILALTATATKHVVQDIQEKLHFAKPNVFEKSFARENIAYKIVQSQQKYKDLVDYCKTQKGTGLVYASSRKGTEAMSQLLIQAGISSDFYHAGLDKISRATKQKDWIDNKTRVMVATNAFGMGVDKPDVRFVAHVDIPQSPEAYFQEAGRAGRDEQYAEATLFFEEKDPENLEKQVLTSYPEPEEVRKVYHALCNFLQIPLAQGENQSFSLNLAQWTSNFALNPNVAHYGLKILALEEYLVYEEESYSRSTVHILKDRKEIWQYIEDNHKHAVILRFLLRQYGGVLHEAVPVYEKQLARLCHCTVEKIVEDLLALQEQQWLVYQVGKQEARIAFLQNRMASEHLRFSAARYFARKNEALRKMRAMQYFVSKKICRSVFLLQYFGQNFAEECGHCDICLMQKPKEMLHKQVFDNTLNQFFATKKALYYYQIPPLFQAYPLKSVWALVHEKITAHEFLDKGTFLLQTGSD